MKLLARVTRFESRRMARDFAPVFFALAFPVLLLAVFGGIFGNKPAAPADGGGYVVDHSVPAYLVLVLAVTGLMSFPLGLAEYRDRKILKRFRATPVNASAFLVAQGVVNVVLTLTGALLLVTVGYLRFGLHLPRFPWYTVGALLLATLALYAMGAVIAAVAPSERAATAIANLVYFPMIFLSGATVPLRLFPPTMRTIADTLPTTYAVSLLQATWLGSATDLPLDIGVLAGVLLLSTSLAVRLFRWE